MPRKPYHSLQINCDFRKLTFFFIVISTASIQLCSYYFLHLYICSQLYCVSVLFNQLYVCCMFVILQYRRTAVAEYHNYKSKSKSSAPHTQIATNQLTNQIYMQLIRIVKDMIKQKHKWLVGTTTYSWICIDDISVHCELQFKSV